MTPRTTITSLLHSDLGSDDDLSRDLRTLVAETLASREAFSPFPAIEERRAWDSLAPAIRAELIRRGDEVAGTEWPSLLATRYLDFSRDGNRSRFAEGYFDRRTRVAKLLFAECCDDSGSRLNELVDGIWLICEETSWCVPAHVSVQRAGIGLPDVDEPIVDLFAAETGALLAWTLYLVRRRLGSISSLIVDRIEAEITRRILEPCTIRDDFWWMGFGEREVNNWNPWINSNWLAALLLVGDGDARIDGVIKTARSIDRFVGPYPSDGGCDEGPSYWGRAGASLFDYLELLSSALGDRFDPFRMGIVREIGRFIFRVHISGSYFVNFADAPAVVTASGNLIERFGIRIEDDYLAGFGSWLTKQSGARAPDPGLIGSPGRVLPELFGRPNRWRALEEAKQTPDGRKNPPASSARTVMPAPPLPRYVWLSEIQVMVARDREGSSDGWFVAAKGGHNAESHNHNDIGSFVVYRDGAPVIADAGVETYTRKTFSEDRYDIWTMQSSFHSLLPTIAGEQQHPGKEFAAAEVEYGSTEATAELALDMSNCYPDSVGLRSWRRRIRLERGSGVVIDDQCELLHPVSEISFSILTPCVVAESNPGLLELTTRSLPQSRIAGSAVLRYDNAVFEASIVRIPIEDDRLGGVWGDYLMRVIFTQKPAAQSNAYRFEIGS